MDGKLGRFLQDGELLLREFDNAEDLLQENALFAKIFYSLCQGESSYKLIEQLVGMIDSYQGQITNILQNKSSAPIQLQLNEENVALLFRESLFSDSDYPDW